MTTRVIVDKRNKRVFLDLDGRVEKTRGAISEALKQMGQISVDYTRHILNTGQKTGRQYKSLPNRSSAPFQAPATQTGRLARSVEYVSNGADRLEVGDTVDYGKFLEDGTRRMKPRPHLLVTANEKASELRSIMDKITREKLK